MFVFWVWFDLVYFLYDMEWHIPVVRFDVINVDIFNLSTA